MPENSAPDVMLFSLPADRWPLVVVGLRLEGSPDAVESADSIEAWLVDVQNNRARLSEAMARLERYKRKK
jgi:glycine cleavage system H lipoate-binding protein